ncbi:GTPase [Candidatus Pyrohabitans sp.]
MAIDKNTAEELLRNIDGLFEEVVKSLDLKDEHKNWLKQAVLDPAIQEIKELVEESRPPVMYFIGRSGHGKSSLVNALANKEVVEVGHVVPTTFESTRHTILFEEAYSTWDIIDSRGLFETTSPDGGPPHNVVEEIKKDLKKYEPDIFLHVISAPEARNLQNDFKVFKEICEQAEDTLGSIPPSVIILNKIDTLGNPRDWPPEKSAEKGGLINDLLKYMIDDVLKIPAEPIDLNYPIKGYRLNDERYIGIIPVSSLKNDLWNIETLSDFIGTSLPESAQLNYYQAQRRKEQLRKICRSHITNRFAKIAGGIGASPVPISDIAVLTPLQLLMIAMIGGLSCRDFSTNTAKEFIKASSTTFVAAVGLREVARQLVKLVPGAGMVISGAIAAAGTYTIGRAAEAYFFSGEIRKPEEFKNEWEEMT